MQNFFTKAILLPLALATLGGLVRILHKSEARSLGKIFASMLAAGFVGTVMYLLISGFKIPDGMKAAIVGMSGYASGSILPGIEKWLASETKNVVPGLKNKNEETKK